MINPFPWPITLINLYPLNHGHLNIYLFTYLPYCKDHTSQSYSKDNLKSLVKFLLEKKCTGFQVHLKPVRKKE